MANLYSARLLPQPNSAAFDQSVGHLLSSCGVRAQIVAFRTRAIAQCLTNSPLCMYTHVQTCTKTATQYMVCCINALHTFWRMTNDAFLAQVRGILC